MEKDQNNVTVISSVLKNTKKYLIGNAAGIILTLLFICIFSFMLTIKAIPDDLTTIFAVFSVALGALTAGFISCLLVKEKGLVNGITTGILFFFIHLLFGLAFGKGILFSLFTLLYLVIDIIFGAIGGIISVNIKR